MSSLLDALFIARPLEDARHEDSRRMHLLRIDPARLHQPLHLGDRDARRRRHDRIEIAGGLPVHEIAQPVPHKGLDQGVVGREGGLQDEVAAAERARLLAVGHHRSVPGRRVERRDARPAGPDLLGERSLGQELDLQLARQELLLEQLVLPHVGGDHLADLAGAQEKTQTEIADPRVVAHDRQVLRPPGAQRPDQVFGDAAQSEAPDHEGGAVRDVPDRLVGVPHHLAHRAPSRSPPPASRSSIRTPPVERGWMNAIRDPSAPGRPAAPAISSPALLKRSSVASRSSTSKQRWWIPSPRFSRKRAKVVPSVVGSTSSMRVRPAGSIATRAPSPSTRSMPRSSSPRTSRYSASRSSIRRTATPRWSSTAGLASPDPVAGSPSRWPSTSPAAVYGSISRARMRAS